MHWGSEPQAVETAQEDGLRDLRGLPSPPTCCMVVLVGLSLCICKMEKQTPTAVKTGVETGLCAFDGLAGGEGRL